MNKIHVHVVHMWKSYVYALQEGTMCSCHPAVQNAGKSVYIVWLNIWTCERHETVHKMCGRGFSLHRQKILMFLLFVWAIYLLGIECHMAQETSTLKGDCTVSESDRQGVHKLNHSFNLMTYDLDLSLHLWWGEVHSVLTHGLLGGFLKVNKQNSTYT